MEREEDDYEDIVNEEKKAEATAGQSTCLLSFLILVTYDKDGNPVKTISKEPNVITSLQRESSYPPCKKDFYTAEEYTPSDALKQWILDNHISIHNLVTGSSTPMKTPPPCPDFRTLPLLPKIADSLLRQFSHPTPIQAASLPLALAGRDIIASSPTGSGKTLCYLLPLVVHILGQPCVLLTSLITRTFAEADAPCALVMVPTRELAEQIAAVAKPLFALCDLALLCVTGGQSEWQQKKALFGHHYHCVVGTPGRLIEIVNEGYLPLKWCSFLVLDEADRMVSMGFEKQIRSILSVVRPDPQLLLFSATFPPRVVRLAVEMMHTPVRVAVGRAGLANASIQQEVVVVRVRASVASDD